MSQHKHGGDIYTTSYRIDFSANLNPLGMPEAVAQAACAGVRMSANYPDVACTALREALAEKEGVSQDMIICGNGAAELIFLLAQAQKPRRAVLTAPGFAEYAQALEAQGCEISYYLLREEQGFVLGEDYLELLDDSVDMIFLCNPNNPTGVQIPRELLLRILEKCETHKIRMVLDVCFMEFLEYPQESGFSAEAVHSPHLFLLKAFTKTYAMAGLRLGYGICSDSALLKTMERLRQPWSVSLPAQTAGIAALREEAYVLQARTLVAQERRWLRQELRRLGFTVYGSAANYLFFQGKKGLAQACREHGILIRDCSNYHGLCEGYYRVAVRTHEENETLIKTLETCVLN